MVLAARRWTAECYSYAHWTSETVRPALSRPHADTLYNSTLSNLKELRVQYSGDPWRILFVFDPKRQAILLVGGNKEDKMKTAGIKQILGWPKKDINAI